MSQQTDTASRCLRDNVAHCVTPATHSFVAAAIVLLAAISAFAAGSWRVAQGDVTVKCPMTIGGSFDAKTGAIAGTLTSNGASALDGSLAVDLRSLDTGISLRNDHMREHYLEVDTAPGYDKAVLAGIALAGVTADAPQGKGTFTGRLTLHGVTRTVTGPVEVRSAGSGLRVKASFPVNLPDYNIPEPRYLGVGVRNTVQVDVTFTTTQ